MIRMPNEFHYFQNIEKPAVVRQRQWIKRLLGYDPALPEAVISRWAASYYDADPVAEAFIADVYLVHGQHHGRQWVEQALSQGVHSIPDAPDSMLRLFAELENEPDWLDWSKVALGAKVFRRYGPKLYSFLGAITLDAYQENSVSKPLALTGAYAGESANRRFLETAAFWRDVSAPNAMRPHGLGVKTALRVRLMHVFVRKHLLNHPEWNVNAWGMPISQGDALLTLIAGAVAPGLGLKLMGFRPTDEEILAMMHFWRYVGYIMGVQPRWYPETIAEGVSLLWASFIKGPKLAGHDGRLLAQSYVQSFAPSEQDSGWLYWQKKLDYWLELGYTNLFLPPKTYRQHGLPRIGHVLGLHPLMQAPFIFTLETIRRHSSWADELRDKLAQRASERWLTQHLGTRQAEYQAVEQFTR